MTIFDRLLRIAKAFTGARGSALTFEPLIADWQREWNDARGFRRVWITISGATAFAWSLVRTADLSHVVSWRPAAGFALTVGLFSCFTLILALQPVQYIWRHWDWSRPNVFWVARPGLDFIWLAPEHLAFGILLGILPASILLAAHHAHKRRIFIACVSAIIAMVMVNGWLTPAALIERRERFMNRINHQERERHPLLHPTLPQLITLATDERPQIARGAQLQLLSESATVLSALAFALLGTVVGRARARQQLPISFGTIAAWWAFGWIVFRLLQYWSSYLRGALGVRLSLATWLPPIVLLTIAVFAWWLAERRLPRANTQEA